MRWADAFQLPLQLCAPLIPISQACLCRHACSPRAVRALSRQAAFLERLLCSPCQAGHPPGVRGAVL